MAKDDSKPYIDVTSIIWNGFEHATDDELYEMLKTGLIYRPYTPLQVSCITPNKASKDNEKH